MLKWFLKCSPEILWGLQLSEILLARREPLKPWLSICYCKEVVGTKGDAIHRGSAVFTHQRAVHTVLEQLMLYSIPAYQSQYILGVLRKTVKASCSCIEQ